MYESVDSSAIEVALGKLAAVRRALQAIDPATLSREQLLELAAVLETDTRRAATVMHAVVAELEMRGGRGRAGLPVHRGPALRTVADRPAGGRCSGAAGR